MANLQHLSNADLNRAIATARAKRDAFAAGREPADVLANLSRLLAEQTRRREARSAQNVANFVNRFGR